MNTQLSDSEWAAETLPGPPLQGSPALEWKHGPDTQFRFGVAPLLSNGQFPMLPTARWFASRNRATSYGRLTFKQFAVLIYYVKTRQPKSVWQTNPHPASPKRSSRSPHRRNSNR